MSCIGGGVGWGGVVGVGGTEAGGGQKLSLGCIEWRCPPTPQHVTNMYTTHWMGRDGHCQQFDIVVYRTRISYHTRMVHTVCVRYVPYAYGMFFSCTIRVWLYCTGLCFTQHQTYTIGRVSNVKIDLR